MNNQYLKVGLHQEDAQSDDSISPTLIQLENSPEVHRTHAV